jgi:hypothetical protein
VKNAGEDLFHAGYFRRVVEIGKGKDGRWKKMVENQGVTPLCLQELDDEMKEVSLAIGTPPIGSVFSSQNERSGLK